MSQGGNPTQSPPYGTSGGEQGQSQPSQQQQQFRRLSAEEMRALRECGRESFFYRSLPFAGAAVLGVHYLGKFGYLKPHPTYGMYLKFVAAVGIGYFVGKFSYLGKCREKLMNLPNSELAEALRKSQGGRKRQLEMFQEMVTLPDIGGGSGGGGEPGYAPIREGGDMYTSPDFSVSRPPAGQGGADQPAQKSSTTYDELRRQNREEYLRQQFGAGGSSPSNVQRQQPPPEEQPKPKYSYGGPPQQPPSTTKYGDTDFK